MKYKENSKFPKIIGLTGLYSIIACCLVIIGAVCWFTLARKNTDTKINEKPDTNSKDSTYYDGKDSYNSIKDPIEPDTQQTEQKKESVPFEDDDEKEEPIEVKQTFVMPVKGVIVKDFSSTTLQSSATYGDMRLHLGADIECEKNAKINAVSTGEVTDISENALLGKTITINHGNGIIVKYCGMGTVDVKVGSKVNHDTLLGTVGTIPSECADKPHLHLEVLKNGVLSAPLKVLGFE